MEKNSKKLTFKDHLNELKWRSLLIFINFSIGAIVGFIFHKQIEAVLQQPLGQTLYYSNPAGGLAFVMQIAVGVGLVISLPLILFQLMQFARPAFKPVRTRGIITFILCSLILAIVAVVYVYFVSLPAALQFLVSFNSDSIQALINVNDYIRFILAYCAGAVVAFQVPLILLFANKVRRFPPGGLTKLQRPIIIGAIVAAGIITPTVDPVNQLLLAGPIIALFEIGVVAVWTINRKRAKRPVSTGIFAIPQVAALPTHQSIQLPRPTQVLTADIAYNKITQAPVRVANSPVIVKKQTVRKPQLITMDIISKPMHNMS